MSIVKEIDNLTGGVASRNIKDALDSYFQNEKSSRNIEDAFQDNKKIEPIVQNIILPNGTTRYESGTGKIIAEFGTRQDIPTIQEDRLSTVTFIPLMISSDVYDGTELIPAYENISLIGQKINGVPAVGPWWDIGDYLYRLPSPYKIPGVSDNVELEHLIPYSPYSSMDPAVEIIISKKPNGVYNKIAAVWKCKSIDTYEKIYLKIIIN